MVLVAISLRMIGQERELAEKRLSDEQRRRVSDINQQLLTRLESATPGGDSHLTLGKGAAHMNMGAMH